jgi:hypothetical protein
MALLAAALVGTPMLFGWLAYPALAQEQPTAQAPPPSAAPSVLPRPDFHFSGNVGRTYLDSDHVNGTKVAEGQVPRTIPATISIGEGMDIGEDVGSPVDFTYKPPFLFTGEIEKVTFELR